MNTLTSHGSRQRSGFSLAELMVVIVIIGLLATLVVPKVVRNLFVANKQKAKADIVSIASAIDQYAIENNGKYPDGLEALVTPDENGFTYLGQETIPKDPWKQEYGYEPPPPGTHDYRVFTYGSDTVPGGDGDAQDIDNIMIRNGEI